MGAFASLLKAQERAVAKVDDGTWVQAYAQLNKDGNPSVRFLRYMSETETPAGTFDGMNKEGAWDETTLDTVT